MSGVLYIVPTPIGNLEDITLRALNILKKCDAVVCEDTRQTVKLLNHYEIKKPLISFFTYNQFKRIPEILNMLREGKTLALVSDCGTPGISDPGYYLIKEVLDNAISVVPLPGPSAVITALVASGLSTDGFVFLGFLRRKSGKLKKEVLQALTLGKSVVFYESPFRLKKTLTLLKEVLPDNTKAVVAREVTKIYEEFIRGSLGEVAAKLSGIEIKGEIVVILEPQDKIISEKDGEEDEQD